MEKAARDERIDGVLSIGGKQCLRAIYARYSSENQRPESIEDQVACRRLADQGQLLRITGTSSESNSASPISPAVLRKALITQKLATQGEFYIMSVRCRAVAAVGPGMKL